jgi:putative membrane protein
MRNFRHTRRALGALAIGGSTLVLMAQFARSQPAAPPTQASAQSAALDDPTIVAIFDAANTWDIESSGLGAKKSHNKDIVALGKMFVRDHENVRQQGRDLAKKLNVTPTPPKDFQMYKDHVAAMAKLNTLSGPAFDRAYLENEVAYHKAVIDAIQATLLPAIQNAELKDLVVKVAPAFQAHMMAAQQLLDKQPMGN